MKAFKNTPGDYFWWEIIFLNNEKINNDLYALNGKRIWENGLTSFPLKSTRIKFTSIDDFRRKRNQLIRL